MSVLSRVTAPPAAGELAGVIAALLSTGDRAWPVEVSVESRAAETGVPLRSAEAWIEGGNVLVRLGRYDQAGQWLAAARKVLPEDPEIATLQSNIEKALKRARAPKP